MLELLKELLNINTEDTSKDTILNFYLDLAQKAIKNYLNVDSLEELDLDNAIIELTTYFYNNRDKVGYTQISQGSRSVTLSQSKIGIPSHILAILPSPRVKVVG